MIPMCADLVKLGGGEPHEVGAVALHEQRPSPPIERAACIAAISLSPIEPGVLRIACSAAVSTGCPVSTLPWIVLRSVPICPTRSPAHAPAPVPVNVISPLSRPAMPY